MHHHHENQPDEFRDRPRVSNTIRARLTSNWAGFRYQIPVAPSPSSSLLTSIPNSVSGSVSVMRCELMRFYSSFESSKRDITLSLLSNACLTSLYFTNGRSDIEQSIN
jgi:hypothetical protein